MNRTENTAAANLARRDLTRPERVALRAADARDMAAEEWELKGRLDLADRLRRSADAARQRVRDAQAARVLADAPGERLARDLGRLLP